MPYFLQSTTEIFRHSLHNTHFTTLTEIIKNNTIKNILKYVMETKRLEIPGA